MLKSNFMYGNYGLLNYERPKEKKGCFFYEEAKDMGAHIPFCKYYQKPGNCPCENCKKYIRSSEVFKGVRDYVDGKEKMGK